MDDARFTNLFSRDEIDNVFDPPGKGLTAEQYHNAIGNPVGTEDILNIALGDPPRRYATKEDAQAAGAEPGARTAHWLCMAIVAKAAFHSGYRRDDGRRGGLHKMWREHEAFNEFAALCFPSEQ